MSGYPDGCTQAMHDAAFNVTAIDTARANERQRQLEERAEDLMRTQAPEFVDYVNEERTGREFASLVAMLCGGRADVVTAELLAEQIADDWREYYVARGEL